MDQEKAQLKVKNSGKLEENRLKNVWLMNLMTK